MWHDVKKTQRRRTRHFQKRNPVTLRHFVPVFKFGIKLALFAGLMFLGTLACKGVYKKLLKAEYFYVNKMVFKGCEKADENKLYKISGVGNDTSMFSLDLRELAGNIKKDPWVKSVSVKKQLPDKLYVGITEREPIAIVNIKNLYYVDEDGVVFKKLSKGDDTNFLVITGLPKETAFGNSGESEELLSEAIALINMLEERDNFSGSDVSEINIDTMKGITLFTYKNATPIKIGFDFTHKRFDKLSRVLKELKRKSLTAEYIDIDYDKRVVVKLAVENNT